MSVAPPPEPAFLINFVFAVDPEPPPLNAVLVNEFVSSTEDPFDPIKK